MPMAYLLTHFWPAATEEQYRATMAVGFSGQPEERVAEVMNLQTA
jgi:hypothetical protein